ncbi:MAG TPA: hypothetical protein DHV42_03835, partial [Lachnospiraceae bacterium]|nr:hypothetical protein [Lachnospiraceae bacterium]
MSRYWNTGSFEQPSVEELRRRAEESARTAARKGQSFEPVVPQNKRGPICTSWWGQAWCENLERYADFESRIERGKRYVRSGTVVDMKIGKGKVTARVQGSRKTPYKVEIRISPLSESKCQRIIEQCGRRISNVEKLVHGEFPEELKEVFLSDGGLFPTPMEISFSCSCPDWALMCKHVAAAMYGIGVRFDENPFFFFNLRGIDVDRFIDVTLESRVESMLEHADCKSGRIIRDA